MEWPTTPIRRAASTPTTATNVTGRPRILRQGGGDFSSFGQAILNKLIAEIAAIETDQACRVALTCAAAGMPGGLQSNQ